MRRNGISEFIINNDNKDNLLSLPYCIIKDCPSHALFDCNFCKRNYCITHCTLSNDSKCNICIICENNNHFYDIFTANNNVIEIKNSKFYKFINCLSFEWIYLKKKIKPI